MTFILLAVSAVVPSLLLVWYFHTRDVHPEPPAVLWRTFGLGIVITFPVVLVALPLDEMAEEFSNPLTHGLVSAFLGAAIPEEFFKFLVLWLYAARHREFNEPMDGIVYGATASLGFATLENILYVADGGFGVAVTRAILSVPAHAFLGAIMGYYVGRAVFLRAGNSRRGLLAKALVIPILLHGLYDTPLLAAGEVADFEAASGLLVALLPLAPLIVAFAGIWTVRLVRRLRAEQLTGTPFPERAPEIPAPPVPAPGAPAGRLGGWILTLLGGVFASAGGLVVLGVGASVVLGTEDISDPTELLVGALAIGVLPLALGCVLFVRGIRRLNR